MYLKMFYFFTRFFSCVSSREGKKQENSFFFIKSEVTYSSISEKFYKVGSRKHCWRKKNIKCKQVYFTIQITIAIVIIFYMIF